jgi:hypothetical protein
MRPLTTSVYTYSNLVEGGFLYVDKTAAIHQFLKPAFCQYFLSRPRRFGKSLLVSTLKSIFEGRRELFKGLFLDTSDYDWPVYPVIHLDLGAMTVDTTVELQRKLNYELEDNATRLGLSLAREDAAERFQELIQALAARNGRVVILIDEYDKPILGHLGKSSVLAIQEQLKKFYSVVKKTEALQRFALITGVSKFSKVSIFSDLNNLTDLTMNAQAATLLGYTQTELEANFPEYLEALATATGRTRAQTLEAMRAWYNGYRFEADAETVYNPVSVMKCFLEMKFKNYWFETGTPGFLIQLLKRQPINLGDLSAGEELFSTYDPANLEPLALLVQTGYLTIKSAESFGDSTSYRLGYPNKEIEHSFSHWLAQGFSELPSADMTPLLHRLVAALRESRLEDLLDTLRLFFAKIPNTITLDHEKYYQTIFFTVFKLIGAVVEAEVSTNIGRIDAIVKTATDIFVFEFKLDGTARRAMEQIRKMRYFEPYLDDGRRVTLVGAAFSKKTRNLGKFLVEAP